MKKYLKLLRWHWDKYWINVTIYQVISFSGIIWLIGTWLWIIPVYQERIQALKNHNRVLENFLIKSNQLEQLTPQQMVTKKIEYDQILRLILLNNLSLQEYKENKVNKKSQYQVILKGSWLNTRNFLNEFDSRDFPFNPIHSLDIQRDKETNQISTTLVVTE